MYLQKKEKEKKGRMRPLEDDTFPTGSFIFIHSYLYSEGLFMYHSPGL